MRKSCLPVIRSCSVKAGGQRGEIVSRLGPSTGEAKERPKQLTVLDRRVVDIKLSSESIDAVEEVEETPEHDRDDLGSEDGVSREGKEAHS